MKRIIALTFAGMLLMSCSATRPVQINLLLHANENPAEVDNIVRDASETLSLKISSSEQHIPNADVSKNYELYNRRISIFISSAPDDPCNGSPNGYVTFRRGKYDVDIVSTGGASKKDLTAIETQLRRIVEHHNSELSALPGNC